MSQGMKKALKGIAVVVLLIAALALIWRVCFYKGADVTKNNATTTVSGEQAKILELQKQLEKSNKANETLQEQLSEARRATDETRNHMVTRTAPPVDTWSHSAPRPQVPQMPPAAPGSINANAQASVTVLVEGDGSSHAVKTEGTKTEGVKTEPEAKPSRPLIEIQDDVDQLGHIVEDATTALAIEKKTFEHNARIFNLEPAVRTWWRAKIARMESDLQHRRAELKKFEEELERATTGEPAHDHKRSSHKSR